MSRSPRGAAARRLCAVALLAGLGLGPLPAGAAEPAEEADLATLRACLEKADGPDESACLQVVVDPCSEAPDGGTTIGMAACYGRETAAWATILDERLARAEADAAATDAELDEMQSSHESVVDALATSQVAWLAFRDAECARQWAEVQAGTMRLIVHPACERTMTARRAMDLRPSDR